MKYNNNKKNILKIIFILTLVFIWGQSALSRSISTVESRFLTFLLLGNGDSEGLIRKCAHFTEYSILGIELAAIVSGFIKKHLKTASAKWQYILLASLNCGLIIAFIDETIQYLSKREPKVADIWIDLAGVCTGALINNVYCRIRHRDP